MAGRPRTYDEGAALTRAMETFWQQGFEATSVRDLLERMGIKAQSMYSLFGGKDELFVRTLDLYLETNAVEMFATLNAPDANLQSIKSYFDYLINLEIVSGKTRSGCLMVNTVTELGNQNSIVGKRLKKFRARMQNAFLNALRGAQRDKQITSDLELTDGADFLSNTVFGLMVTCKTGVSKRRLESIVAVALSNIRV